MSDYVNKLVAKYAVNEKQTKRIFEIAIFPLLDKFTAEKNPVAVIIGAQPGSGKSQLLTLAQQELRHNIVLCNADDYRKLHPNATEIIRLHEQFFPDITTHQNWSRLVPYF